MQRVSDVDLRLLRVFITVAEAGGFAAAESLLNISTSTISIHMANLEKRLGVRLCERGRGGFRLTERGRAVFDHTKRLMNLLDDYSGELARISSLVSGAVSVGMVDSLVTHPEFPLSRALRRYNEVDNDVRFELIVDSRQQLEQAVLDGRLHAAIGPFASEVAGLRAVALFRERHCVYVGEGHELFALDDAALARAELADRPAVIRMYHHEFDRQRFRTGRRNASVFSMEAMLVLLLSGCYVGYLPAHYAAPWVAAGRLRELPRADLAYESEHRLITRETSRDPIALGRLVALLVGTGLEGLDGAAT